MALGNSRSRTTQLAAHPVMFLLGGIGLFLFSSIVGLAWPAVLVITHFAGDGAGPPLAAIVLIAVFSPVLMYLFVFVPMGFFAEALILFALTWRSLRATDPLAPLVTRVIEVSGRYGSITHFPLQRTRWSGFLEAVRQTFTVVTPWPRYFGFDLLWLAGTAAAGLQWTQTPLLTAAIVVVSAAGGVGLLAWNRSRGKHLLDQGPAPASDPFGLTPAYYKGLASRERTRLRKVAALKVAALAAGGRRGAAPTPFDQWVRAEAKEAFNPDPWIVLRIRDGDEAAIASMVDATFELIEQRMPKDKLRAVVVEAAAFHRKKLVRKPKSDPKSAEVPT